MITGFWRIPRRFLGGGLVLAVGWTVLVIAGCGSEAESHELSGTVTSGGKLVTWGTVTVIGSDHRPYSAPIRPDGTYTVTGLPPGPVQVAVTSPNPNVGLGVAGSVNPAERPSRRTDSAPMRPQASGGNGLTVNVPKGSRVRALGVEGELPPPPPAGAPAASPRTWVPIPGRYGSPSTSGLTTTIGSGQPFNIRAD